MRGKGAPKPKGGHGDLLVTVNVDVPKKLSHEQKELLERLNDAQGSPRARPRSERVGRWTARAATAAGSSERCT